MLKEVKLVLIFLQVLCLDECTANVDNQTAILLQNTISAECKGMTVLTIAHRISTVMKMDNILVLDQGKLVIRAIVYHKSDTELQFKSLNAHSLMKSACFSNSIASKFRLKKETQRFS